MGQGVAISYWTWVPITIAGYGITMAASAGFNGLGRPSFGVMITSGRALLLMAPFAVVGAIVAGAPIGVILGVAAANVIAGIATAFYVLTRAPMEARKRRARKPKPPTNAELPA